jgi:hypothetical protein
MPESYSAISLNLSLLTFISMVAVILFSNPIGLVEVMRFHKFCGEGRQLYVPVSITSEPAHLAMH